MQGKRIERSWLAVFGLLLSLFVTPLWAAELERHELWDGQVSLLLPQGLEQTDEENANNMHLLEFQDAERSVVIGFIVGKPEVLEADSLDGFHDALISSPGANVEWFRDEWHGEEAERYFVVEGGWSDNGEDRSRVFSYGTQVDGDFLLVVIEYSEQSGKQWSAVAGRVIDSIVVRR